MPVHLPLRKPGQRLTVVAERYPKPWLVLFRTRQMSLFHEPWVRSHGNNPARPFPSAEFQNDSLCLRLPRRLIAGLIGLRPSINPAALCQQRKAKVKWYRTIRANRERPGSEKPHRVSRKTALERRREGSFQKHVSPVHRCLPVLCPKRSAAVIFLPALRAMYGFSRISISSRAGPILSVDLRRRACSRQAGRAQQAPGKELSHRGREWSNKRDGPFRRGSAT